MAVVTELSLGVSKDTRWCRRTGMRNVLTHLEQFPGATWQDRWDQSGFADGVGGRGDLVSEKKSRDDLIAGTRYLLCLRVIQPKTEVFKRRR